MPLRRRTKPLHHVVLHLLWLAVPLLSLSRELLFASAEKPPTLFTDAFNYSISYRQSVCERQYLYDNGTVALRNALRGLNLNSFLTYDDRYVRLNDEGAIPLGSAGGLIPALMDELALRAGFQWRNSYGLMESLAIPSNRTYSELLSWTLDTFDISAAYWTKTLERIDLGASYPEGWYDGTFIMVGIEPEGSGSLDVWAFLEPFSTGVWVMIGVTLLVSGLVYMCLDRYDEESDLLVLENKPAQSIWLAAISLTGQFEYQPDTNSARLFTFSLAFFCLLITSAYTANLASFLVVQNTPAVQVTSVGDAVKNDMVFCVIRGTAGDQELKEVFPGAIVQQMDSEGEIYEGVRKGYCDFALTAVSSWNEYSQNKTVNGDCQLTWIGRAFLPRDAGFAIKSDSGTLCTSLIRDVVNLHMVEMKDDGDVDKAWATHLEQLASVDCDTVSEPEDEDTMQLTLQAMGGTFVVHYSLTGLAILVAVFTKWKNRRREKREAKVPPAPVPTSTNSPERDASNRSVMIEPEDRDLFSRYEKMVQEHDAKMSEILSLVQAMQRDSNEKMSNILGTMETMQNESKSIRKSLCFPQSAPGATYDRSLAKPS